jgi:hypothetical protein
MTPSRPTVAEVVRSCLDEFLERYGLELTPEQRRALKDLASCRAAAVLQRFVAVRYSAGFESGRSDGSTCLL